MPKSLKKLVQKYPLTEITKWMCLLKYKSVNPTLKNKSYISFKKVADVFNLNYITVYNII